MPFTNAVVFTRLVRMFPKVLFNDLPQTAIGRYNVFEGIQVIDQIVRLTIWFRCSVQQNLFIAGKVFGTIEQNTAGFFSISSGSSDLLDVVIHSQWKSGVYDKVDVGFIDSQAECCCRNNEGTIFRFELIENAFALLFRQFSVEAQRFPILALASSE